MHPSQSNERFVPQSELKQPSPTLWEELGIPRAQSSLFELHFAPTTDQRPLFTPSSPLLQHLTHFINYLDGQSVADQALLSALHSQVGPMHPECRISVCIPVAGREEGGHIRRCLSAYLDQSLARTNFEILLFVNWPIEEHESPFETAPAQTVLDQIKDFQDAHPDLQIHTAAAGIGRSALTIGRVRALGTDLAILRHLLRDESPGEDHIIMRNDADTTALHENYLRHFLGCFKEHPKTDLVFGKLDFDLLGYAQDPYVYLGSRLFMALEASTIIKDKWLHGGIANAAFRASTYVAVGGYDREATCYEDYKLSLAIRQHREGDPEWQAVRRAGFESRLYSSCRRALAAIEFQIAPALQWERKEVEFKSTNPEVRIRKVDRGDAYFREEVSNPQFRKKAEDIVSQTLGFYYRGLLAFPDKERLAKRRNIKEATAKILTTLGFDFYFDRGGFVEITDVQRAIPRFLHFQRTAHEILKKRTSSR